MRKAAIWTKTAGFVTKMRLEDQSDRLEREGLDFGQVVIEELYDS